MPPLAPVTQALLLINVGVFCIDYMLGGLLTRWFALYPIGPNFMPWQLVSYAFLHDVGNLFHIVFNMLGLWMFGAELERLWGPKRYLQYYAASVLAAGLSQLLLSALLDSQAPTIGASGGIFGLLLAFGMMFPNRRIMLLIPPIPMKAKIFVAIYGALELFLGVSNPYGGVAHFAHLGGMLGGFLMIQYWRGKPPFGRR